MANPFNGRAVPIGGPATDIVPVVPNDSVDLADAAVALFISFGGDVVIETVRGSAPRTAMPATGRSTPPCWRTA